MRVIDEYLEERYGPPRLTPSDPALRMRVREIENFADEARLANSIPLFWMAYWSSRPSATLMRWKRAARFYAPAICRSSSESSAKLAPAVTRAENFRWPTYL